MKRHVMVAAFLLAGLSVASRSPAQPAPTRERELLDAVVQRQSPQAALELAKRGAPAAGALKRLARNTRVAGLLAWALWQHPSPAAAEPLRALLKTNDQVAAYWAARALGRLGDPAAAEDLAAMLPKQPNYYWEIGRGQRIRIRTPEARNVKTPEFAPPDMPNVRVTYAALLALGELGGPLAARTLAEAAGRPLYVIRHAACRGLGSMRARGQLARLREMALRDPVLIVRDAAAEAVARIEGAAGPPEAPLPPMPRALVFLKTRNRSESNMGFRDSYFVDKTPWYHSGEDLYLLSPVWPPEKQKLRNLTNLQGRGAVQGAELSFDARRIVFAMRRDAKTDGFHIYELDLAGGEPRPLTSGNCNDVDPAYLPDGRILFCSDRAGYHEYYHQERSRVLYAMRADGSDIQQVTFNPNQDYDPVVLRSGWVVYSSYRFYAQDGSPGPVPTDNFMQRIETVFRTIRPDGSGDDLFYGAMRGSYFTPIRPTPDSLQYSGWHPRGHHIGVAVSQPRELPDGRVVCITPAGLSVVDPALPRTDCERPVWPEIINLAGGEEVYIHNHDDMNPHGRYTSPYPAAGPDSPRGAWPWVFVAHAPWYDLRKNGYGLYLFDLAGRRTVRVYDDPESSDVEPLAVFERPAPTVLSSQVDPTSRLGRIYCVSAFHSDLPYDRGAARYVRVIAARFQGLTMNANASFRTRVLGETPLEKDGSFFVEVPADTPLRFELLDAGRRVIVHETAFNYVRPGETKGCMGCHEPKDTPLPHTEPLAVRKAPARAYAKRGDLIYQGRPYRTYSHIVRD
ncbi:MAG TPA: HEAT repeat domain-containing protein [Phycisphaerae bacterium]|nr:HEAT repeat domain-containing protein [Phycisphaerae bacterium]